MTYIDNLLNKITMYRLVLYYLLALFGAAIIFGALGVMSLNPLSIVVSTLIVLAVCWLTNRALAAILLAPVNVESAYITALILALIISPIKLAPFDWAGFGFLVSASIFAMASKYMLAANRKHIFNPAAIAVVLTAFIFNQYASWWVGGNIPLLAFVLIGGLLIVRKIQRFDLVIAFFVAALASIILTNTGYSPLAITEQALIHTSLFFFAFVMLTEPLTTPPTRPLRIAYGLLVGALFSPAIHIGSVYATPELALVVGNLFSFAVSPKKKYVLKLSSKQKIADDIYNFVFSADGKANTSKFNFRPGQYMEWTMPTGNGLTLLGGHDDRGNRRYFTIASSPTETEIHLGVKFYGEAAGEPGMSSSFKKKLLALQPGDRILAGSLAGDFTLPRATKKSPGKFVFIAGGIGITPFRSMIKYLSDASAADSGKTHDIVLLYSNRNASEIAYRETFDEAEKAIALKTIYVNTNTDGRIDADFIEREIPDWRERMYYLSGPHTMVVAFENELQDLGVPRSKIKTDFFPGFA